MDAICVRECAAWYSRTVLLHSESVVTAMSESLMGLLIVYLHISVFIRSLLFVRHSVLSGMEKRILPPLAVLLLSSCSAVDLTHSSLSQPCCCHP